MSRVPLLHSVVGLEGPWAILVELVGTLVLMLHITALVLLGEGADGRTIRLRWAAVILLVPVAGPLFYLVHERHRLRLPETP